MNCCNDQVLIYKKMDPEEIILKGDVVMLDTSSSYITRAFAKTPEQELLNSRLVIGICLSSDTESDFSKIIDGGNASSNNISKIINGGNAYNTQTIIIDAGGSGENKREVIQIAYSGEQLINTHGRVRLGDKLCISHFPGKAKSKSYLDDINCNEFRTIGKVVQVLPETNQVKALLDIE